MASSGQYRALHSSSYQEIVSESLAVRAVSKCPGSAERLSVSKSGQRLVSGHMNDSRCLDQQKVPLCLRVRGKFYIEFRPGECLTASLGHGVCQGF